MKTQLTLALAALLVAAAVPAVADSHQQSYSLDAAHSHIGFTAVHFGLSKVRGAFNEFSAELAVDEDDLANSKIVLTIATPSIDTGNDQRDGHLKSNDFLNVEKYPTITFESVSMTAQGDGVYDVVGNLTIRDTTREITFPVEVMGPLNDPWGNVRVGISGEAEIDRQEYDVAWDNTLPGGELVVSDEVAISFSLEALRPTAEEAEEE